MAKNEGFAITNKHFDNFNWWCKSRKVYEAWY